MDEGQARQVERTEVKVIAVETEKRVVVEKTTVRVAKRERKGGGVEETEIEIEPVKID